MPLMEKKNQEKHPEQPRPLDWQNAIGKTIISKDNLDMGKVIVDHDSDYNTSYSITIEYGDHQTSRRIVGYPYNKELSSAAFEPPVTRSNNLLLYYKSGGMDIAEINFP
jgi:hypothetical protein